MSTLVVDRLSATTPAGLQARTRGLLAGVADRRLGDALRRSPLPDGDWYLRRLDVRLSIDPARPDPSIEEAWAATLVDALQDALRSGSADVVHYRHRVDALVDLVASLAGGDDQHAWAWHQAGLVATADLSRLGSPGAVVMAALHESPESVVAVLVRTLARVELPRLHRLLGASGWVAAAELAARAVHADLGGAPQTGARLPWSAHTREPSSAPGGAQQSAAGAATLPERVTRDLAVSRLVAAFRRGSIRPGAEVAAAWAVLALAETDPSVLCRVEPAGVVETALAALGVGPHRADGAGPADQRELLDGGPATVGKPAGLVPEAGRIEDPDDETPQTWPTVWGGLLFLLSTAAASGVPGGLSDDPVLGERPLSWCLHALATRLVPAADDDPAVLVFAGLPIPSEPPTHSMPPSSAAEDPRLDEVAATWAEVTAARLGSQSNADPFDVVRDLSLRRGVIAWEPGWVEVHLRLDDVDVDVRRAGLDLDPGWVPWLGMVVRFCHG